MSLTDLYAWQADALVYQALHVHVATAICGGQWWVFLERVHA